MIRSKFNPHETPEALAQAYYNAGPSVRVLAEQCGVSRNTVRNWLQAAGIPRIGPGGPNNPRGRRKYSPPPSNPFKSQEQAQLFYNECGSESAVARHFQVSQRLAQIWLNKWGVKRFPRGNRPKGMTTPNMGDES